MRRHGWSGDIPADDDEAVRRIIGAARQAIDARGTVSVSEVAQALGITRQTVYRYFPTLESLMVATAVSTSVAASIVTSAATLVVSLSVTLEIYFNVSDEI